MCALVYMYVCVCVCFVILLFLMLMCMNYTCIHVDSCKHLHTSDPTQGHTLTVLLGKALSVAGCRYDQREPPSLQPQEGEVCAGACPNCRGRVPTVGGVSQL